MALLGVYNYVRFGNPLEPGPRYLLSVIDLNQLAGSRTPCSTLHTFLRISL